MIDEIADINVPGWLAPENRITLEWLILRHDIRSVIEVGSFLGLSAIWFARRVDHVTCIDKWTMDAEAPNSSLVLVEKRWELPSDLFPLFRENVTRAGVWSKIHPIRGDSHVVYAQAGEADLVYIDGDHSYLGCKRDIELYRPLARKVICGDDYEKHPDFAVIEAVTDTLPNHQSCKRFWWAIK